MQCDFNTEFHGIWIGLPMQITFYPRIMFFWRDKWTTYLFHYFKIGAHKLCAFLTQNLCEFYTILCEYHTNLCIFSFTQKNSYIYTIKYSKNTHRFSDKSWWSTILKSNNFLDWQYVSKGERLIILFGYSQMATESKMAPYTQNLPDLCSYPLPIPLMWYRYFNLVNLNLFGF
jgi:hypothetical protein